MSNERIYNIALDKFMEEAYIHLKNYLERNFRKKLYYNNEDKEFILYQLSPNEAQRIWETLVNNIHNHKRMEGFAKSLCPFCIKFKNCDDCPYKKNHNNCEDMEYILDLIKENSISDTQILTNKWYRETIKRIREELFNNINNNPKKFTIDYDNFRIIVKQNYKNNKIDKFPCDALYSWYDFTHQRVGDEIISANDIEDINNREFENVDPKIVKTVFELAEKCEVSNNGGVLYNFIVYPNGEITINYDMKRIKDFLEEIKKEYNEYLKNRCNIVKVEVKD